MRLYIKLNSSLLFGFACSHVLHVVKLHSLGKEFSVQEDSMVAIFSEFFWKIISLTVFEVCSLMRIYISMLDVCLKGLCCVFAVG